MAKTPIYCLYSSQMKTIFEKHFYPSFMQFNSDDFELTVFNVDVEGNGDFDSDGYMKCMHHKTAMMLKTIKENLGKHIVWTDIDIRFLSKIDLTSYTGNFTVLKEHYDVSNQYINPAFCRIQCNDVMVNFFEKLLDSCKKHDVHDMDIMNYFKDTIPAIQIDVFDFRYIQYTSLPHRTTTFKCDICKNNTTCYNCLHQLVDIDYINKDDTILFHANCTIANSRNTSMGLKLEQLDYLVK